MLSFLAAMLLGFTPHRTLYPTTRALQTGTLPVTEPHKLYYEVHGKAGGAPALFLHGGPGAGCAVRHAGFFDPKHYQIVLFDQRGCGRSTPTGELQDNNAAELVQDCERLREHLRFDRWACVLGGSWGTTLALAYSGAHPDRVGSIVMRAVCLMRATEIRWLFGLGGGMSRLLPGTWYPLQQHWEKERATSTVALGVALPEAPADELLCWYADALGGRLSDKAMSEASGSWGRYEMSVFGLSSRLPAHKLETLPGVERSTWVWEPQAQQWTAGAMVLPANEVREALVDRFEERMAASLLANGFVKQEDLTAAADRAAASAAAAAADRAAVVEDAAPMMAPMKPLAPTVTATAPKQPTSMSTSWVPAQARLTSHYSVARGFVNAEGLLSTAVPRIREACIPCIAVHGANDLICPPVTAYELHEAWPEMELRVVPGAGHSMYDSQLQAEILRATDLLRTVSTPGPTQSVAPSMVAP